MCVCVCMCVHMYVHLYVCVHMWALDQNKAVLLVCLDLNAAFDTIDHKILINRLEKQVGITETCLSWCHSFLTNRKQLVVIQGMSTTMRDLSSELHQGSVDGPKCSTSICILQGILLRSMVWTIYSMLMIKALDCIQAS